MLRSTITPRSHTVSTSRLSWIDLLRGGAVLFVILNHAIGMTQIAGWPIPGWLSLATRTLEPYRLPMLLVVSGMFLPRALRKPAEVYVSGKIRNLVWPLLLWAPVTVLTHIPQRAADPAVWIGPSHLWYLRTLVFCYAVALLARRVPLWVFPTVFLGALFTGVTDDVNLFWFGSFFFIGALVEPLAARLQRAPRWAFALMVAAAVVGSWLHVTGLTRGQNPTTLALALAGVAAMLWVAPRLPRGLGVQLLERLGRRSIVYYVVHLPVIAVLLRILDAVGAGTAVTLPVVALAAVAVPFGVSRISGHEVLFSMPEAWVRQARRSASRLLQPDALGPDGLGDRLALPRPAGAFQR